MTLISIYFLFSLSLFVSRFFIGCTVTNLAATPSLDVHDSFDSDTHRWREMAPNEGIPMGAEARLDKASGKVMYRPVPNTLRARDCFFWFFFSAGLSASRGLCLFVFCLRLMVFCLCLFVCFPMACACLG
jgi:hypothetical protein